MHRPTAAVASPTLGVMIITCVVIITLSLILGDSGATAMPLPDSRVYELVSPAEKSGGIGGVFPLGSITSSPEEVGRPLQSSTDGKAITYLGEDFYHPQLGSLNQYFSLRSPTGWVSQNLTLGVPSVSEQAVEANRFVDFSSDLTKGIISSAVPLVEGVPAGYANLYLTRGTEILPLLLTEPPNRKPATTFGHSIYGQGEVGETLLFAGGNTGSGSQMSFSHLFFEANDALTPNALDEGKFKNNLYEWFDGTLRLVNILPNGQTHPNASFGVDNSDVYVKEAYPSLSNVISADGSRIFWTDESTGNLYVRENGEKTVQVDLSVGGGGMFQTASTDGSSVFFTKAEKLYEFDVLSGATSELASGGVKGVLGASDNGTHIYFVSNGVLTAGATAGRPNLYLSDSGKLTYITTLSSVDNETPNIYGTLTSYGDWFRTFAGRTSEVSSNGRYVAFMSKENLTEYDNHDAVHKNVRDYEAFLYDAVAEKLACVSCNEDKSLPTSSTLLPSPIDGIYQQRYVTDNGIMFFSTEDGVLPQDTNGKSDVYEYEAGHVYLISPGSDNRSEAFFADADQSGENIFFTTNQQLVPADPGEITDLYDARIGGHEETLGPPSCSGEGCRGLLSGPASFETPPSAVFTGSGNLAPQASGVVVKKNKAPNAKHRRRHVKRATHRRHAKKRAGRLK